MAIKSFGQNYLYSLKSKKDFITLSSAPLSNKYASSRAVKLVYNLKTNQIYYINSKQFKYHYEFCNNQLEDNIDLKRFNKINYSNTLHRNYLLANINYYKSLKIYAIEISPVDLMSKENIIHLYKIISKSTFIKNKLHFLLNSPRLQNISSAFTEKIPILNPFEIYKNLNFQAISKHKGCGTLRFINNIKLNASKIKNTDIIILNKTPLSLPDVAGVIINKFQTPLSHLTILGQNRKIPVAAYKQAFENTALLKLKNKNVCLKVLNDTFNVRQYKTLKTKKTKKKKVELKSNLKVDSLIDIKYLNKKSFKYSGHKACNFGILNKLSSKHKFKVPECAFVIPFYFYNKHVQHRLIKKQFKNLYSLKTKASIKAKLKEIRRTIKILPIDSLLLHKINNKVLKNGNWSRIRFRSSTNAEDVKGFSGAGLYKSKTGVLNNKEKTFESAIKKVWASLWSYKAFIERELYNINHKQTYMGILVHRSFPNEEVNGVIITKNLYRPNNYGFVVNAQLGNQNVVKQKQGIIPDQFICYPNQLDNIYKNKKTIDIITQSSLNGFKLTMTEAEIQHLANQIELIKTYFYKHTFTSKSYLNFGLDIEFKLDHQNRYLYIKQVRPYND